MKDSVEASFGVLVALYGARFCLKDQPTWYVAAADVLQALLALLWVVQLQRSGKDPLLVKFFWFGTVLGCSWEFTFDVLGDDFCSIKVPELLLIPGTRGVAHSLGDGILFSIGVWLARDLCKGPHFANYNLKEFLIMFTWGQLQEIAVDLTGNGWIWHYHPNHWANFTMF